MTNTYIVFNMYQVLFLAIITLTCLILTETTENRHYSHPRFLVSGRTVSDSSEVRGSDD